MNSNFQNWFIYDGEHVQGPFAAESLLAASQTFPRHKQLVVSRVGLDRWYPIAQIEQLLSKTTPTNFQPQNFQQLKASVERKLQEISRVTAAPVPQRHAGGNDPFAQRIPAKVESKTILASIEQELMRQTFEVAETIVPDEPVEKPVPSANAAVPPMIATPGTLSYSPAFNYVVLRGRLRLGELRSPFVAGMILGIFTLGFYWVYWYRNSVRELSWHMYNTFDLKGFPSSFFALIPVAHMMMTYYLAELIRNAEAQNHYRRTSPALAAMLAIFPPFAICYLQSALNHHWRLHVTQQK